MASYDHPNKARDSFTSEIRHRHGRSKAQMCLSKILHIISAFPSDEISKQQSASYECEKLESCGTRDGNRALSCVDRGFDVHLNSRLGPPLELEEFKPTEAAAVALGGGDENSLIVRSDSLGVEKSSESIHGPTEVEKRAIEHSEISNVGNQSSEIDNNGVYGESKTEAKEGKHQCEKLGGEGCLGMLIDAAKLIFGEFESEPEEPSRKQVPSHKSTKTGGSTTTSRTKRKEWYGNIEEDTLPVVRSKRGRSQVLPYKYRDSVLEPFTRLSQHRSTTVSSKRRSR